MVYDCCQVSFLQGEYVYLYAILNYFHKIMVLLWYVLDFYAIE